MYFKYTDQYIFTITLVTSECIKIKYRSVKTQQYIQ